MSYQKIILKAFGGPEQLQLESVAQLPEPAAGEVRVKVLAAGLGFTDTIVRQGQYVDIKAKPPLTPGYDWFGQVDKLGSDVTNLQVGDYVADMPGIGGYSEYLCVAAQQLVKAPAGLDPAEAVAMILSYTTAYQMLTRIRDIQPNDWLVVHGAGGAVGTAMLELAKVMGYQIIGTGSASKQALIESLGAKFINYREQDFVQGIHAITQGNGADIIFDTIGAKNWSRSYQALAKGGTLVGFGALAYTRGTESTPQLLWGFAKLLGLWKLIPDGKHSTFYNVFTRRKKHPEQFREDLQTLFTLLSEGKLHPAIEERITLQDIADAHRRIDKGEVLGKLVAVMK